jgi:hypothetical protein
MPTCSFQAVCPCADPARGVQGLHWYSYAPPRRRWYLSQSTMMNECLYRQRHAYDYLLFMDADEFLVVRGGSCKFGWCIWERVRD